MNPLEYLNIYESIDDFICYIGVGFRLYHKTKFGLSNKNNDKIPFYNEYLYRTTKYSNVNSIISVKRKFQSYLVIEYDDDENIISRKTTIRITDADILPLQKIMSQIDDRKDYVYIKKSKAYTPKDKEINFSYITTDGVIIKFYLGTYEDINDNKIKPCIILSINNKATNINDSNWNTFFYNIKSVRLHELGAIVTSSVTSELIGSNVQDLSKLPISKDRSLYEKEKNNDAVFNGYKPVSKDEKRKSFFDD